MASKRTKKKTNRFAKNIFFVAVSYLALYLIVIFLSSIIANYIVEKHAGEQLQRQISVDRIYVNPITGFISFKNLKIYESKNLPSLTSSDSIFFSAKGVSLNIAMLKLLSKTFEISEIKINQPVGKIIQYKKDYNFIDIITKLSSNKSDTITSPTHFSILNIEIVNGELHYHDKLIPVKYFIKELNISSKGKRWDIDTIATDVSFLSESGNGSLKGNFAYNNKSKDFSIALLVRKFEFDLLNQYLKDISNYGTLRANIDADFTIKGNFNDSEAMSNNGILAINDFHLGKDRNNDYASFAKLVIAVKKLNPKEFIYLYDSIIISQPYLKYEQYENLNNFETMFGKDWAKIAEAKADTTRFNLIIKIFDKLKAIRKNLPKSDFRFNKVVIDNGIVEYNNYLQNEKFSILANPLYISADSIFKTQNRVEIFLKSGIKPFGNLSASLSINPKNKSDFDLKYHLKGVPASLFNPFTINHASYPLNRGTLEINGKWHVQNGEIKSNNHILVIDPRLGKRIKNDDTDWLPLPLIMYLARGNGNVIDFEIPITGNLRDPKFRWSQVFSDVAKNLLHKPTSKSYRSSVKDAEAEIEQSLSLKWEMQQNSLLNEQKKFVKNLVNHLLKNPEAEVHIYPTFYVDKEMEFYSFFEAKKMYFLDSKGKNDQSLSRTDSLAVNNISLKDPLFLAFVSKQVNNKTLFTLQDKCNLLIGSARVKDQLNDLSKARESAFLDYFKQKGIANRVTIHPQINTTPYNGYSIYKITYKGKLPKDLVDAYLEMDKLNTDANRLKYEKKREKIDSHISEN